MALHAAGVELTRKRLACPSCGEEMPVGMVSCRYCRAPLHAVVVENSSFILPLPPDNDGSVSTPVVPPNVPTIEPRKGRRVAEGRPGEKRSKGTAPAPPSKTSAQPLKAKATAVATNEQSLANVSRPPDFETRARVLSCVVVLLLLAPLAVSGPVPGDPSPLSFTWPMIHSGDEPHNLVLINSVLNDGDFDVKNNYADSHSGGNQGGRKFGGWVLDHHVAWYLQDRYVRWWEIYETDEKLWKRDASEHPIPTRKPNFEKTDLGDQEYSRHSPGFAVVTSPFLVFFRGTSLLESAALLATTLMSIAGFFAYCILVRPYVTNPFQAVLFGAVAYLGSPLWHYGRTLYVEAFAAGLLICAYAAVLRGYRYLTAGLCINAAILIRGEFMLIALPLLAEPLWRRDRVCSLCVGIPAAFAICLKLLWNQRMRHGWTHNAELWEWGYPLEGIFGLLLSWQHGILLFAPVLILSVFCVRRWFREHQRDAILMSAAVVSYGLLMGSSLQWWGGTCYSAKLLIPVLPLMLAPMAMIGSSRLWNSDARVFAAIGLLMVISVEFGAIAAFACEHIHEKHPVQLMW